MASVSYICCAWSQDHEIIWYFRVSAGDACGQLFSRVHVGLGSCSQGPAKPWMLGCPAKLRCQAAAGARSPTSSSKTSLTTGEGRALFTAWLLSPSSFYTNQEHNNAQNFPPPRSPQMLHLLLQDVSQMLCWGSTRTKLDRGTVS